MIARSYNALTTRPVFILAALLTALMIFGPAAFAQEANEPITYAEKGIDAVAIFTATDPEDADVIWSTGGTDGSLFTAEGGALMFKELPDYEDPKDVLHEADGPDDGNDPDIEGDTDDPATNNVYVVKVRATEVVPDDQEEPAEYTEIQVRVTVTNVNEDGMASINWRQPQVQETLTATASDPDNRDADGDATTFTFAWQWSVPKVSRPVTGNDNHWVAAAALTSNQATYTPVAGDVGSVLRAQATYTDGTGEERTLNVLTEFEVRAVPDSNDEPNAFDSNDNARSVDENSPKGTLVGAPVTTTDSNPDDVLTYTIPATSVDNPFAIDKVTGQITVDGDVDHEAGGTVGVYTVTVTATDPSGESSNIDISVTAKDVNEKPTVTEAVGAVKTTAEIDSTPETDAYTYNSGLDNLEYTKADVDADDETTFSLAGEDAGQFDMDVDANDLNELKISFQESSRFRHAW